MLINEIWESYKKAIVQWSIIFQPHLINSALYGIVLNSAIMPQLIITRTQLGMNISPNIDNNVVQFKQV